MEAFGVHEQNQSHLQRCFELVAADEEDPFQRFLLVSKYSEPTTTGPIKYRYGEAVMCSVATVSSARGGGGAIAVVHFLKSAELRSGYSRVILYALPERHGIYEKAGFWPTGSSYAVFGERS